MSAATKPKTALRDLPHAPGPYRAEDRFVMANVDGTITGAGEVIVHTVGPGQHANARRIAACLSAFSHLSTPALETLARWGHMDTVRLRGSSGEDRETADKDAVAYILMRVALAVLKGDYYQAQIHAESAVLEITDIRSYHAELLKLKGGKP